jgi:tetratricopeptide (TPR) repeat protein
VEAGELGGHLYESGEYGRALPWLVQAADQAFALCGWRRAGVLYDQVADAGRRSQAAPEVLIHALQRSIAAYTNLTAYDRARERCGELRQAASQAQRPAAEAEAWKHLGEIEDAQRRFPEALDAYAKALACLEGQPFAALRGRIMKGWGCVDFECGRYSQAERQWQGSLELLQDQQAAGVLNNLAVLKTVHGELEEAWGLYERGLGMEGAGEPDKVLALWNMGMLRADQERWDEALVLYGQSLERCRAIHYFFH